MEINVSTSMLTKRNTYQSDGINLPLKMAKHISGAILNETVLQSTHKMDAKVGE